MFDTHTRILIVDDMLTMRKHVSRMCMEIGFTDLVEATDGAHALQLIQNEKPPIGLVISDYDMPKSNGFDLFKRIHNDSRFGNLPFVLIALGAEQDVLSNAIKAGVHGVLTKPFNAEDLKHTLESIQKRQSGK